MVDTTEKLQELKDRIADMASRSKERKCLLDLFNFLYFVTVMYPEGSLLKRIKMSFHQARVDMEALDTMDPQVQGPEILQVSIGNL